MSDKVIEFKPNKNKSKKQGLKIFIIAVIIIGVLGCVYLLINSNDGAVKGPDEKKVLSQLDYEASSMADFYTKNKNIYYCTKDGMSLLDAYGQEVWKDTYSMLDPIMAEDGETVAIADADGRNLRVYYSSGLLYNVEAECPITTFSVNENGYCAMIMKNSSNYILNVYSDSGVLMCTGNYPAEKGIPLAVDISNDNKIYAISFLNTSEIKVSSNVVFYYVEDKDIKSSEDGESMFASFVKDNEIVALMEFMDNNSLIAVSDSEIICAVIDKNATSFTEKWNVELGNQLTAVSFVGNKYVAAANGEALVNSANKGKENLVRWFDLEGNAIAEYESGKAVTGLYSSDSVTIVASGRNFTGINTSGKVLWKYNTVQDTTKALPFDDAGKIMLITPTQMRIVDVNKGDNIDEGLGTEEELTETTTEAVSEQDSEQNSERNPEQNSEATS